MSNVINKGYGTPFVVVYNSDQKPLAANDSNARAFITNFSYKYKEADDDECIITIFLRHSQDLNDMEIKHLTRLYLNWGWLKTANSGMVPVMVKSYKRRYSTAGIFYIITCTDLVSQLKFVKDLTTKKTTLLDYLLGVTSGRYNLKIENQGKLIYYAPLKAHELQPHEIPHRDAGNALSEEDYATGISNSYLKDPVDWDKLSDKQKVQERKERAVQDLDYEHSKLKRLTHEVPYEERDVGTIFDTRQKIKALTFENDKLDQQLEAIRISETEKAQTLNSIFGRYISGKQFDIIPFSSSPYQILESYLKGAPDGPWYVDGKGDVLTIHNRHLEKDPKYYYGYREEPGDLQEFTPDVKFKSNQSNNFMRTTVLDERKGFTNMYHYLHVLKNLRPLKEILDDKLMGDNLKQEEIRTWYMAYLAHDKYGIFQRVESTKEYPEGKRPENPPEDWEGLDNTFLAKVDLHRVYIRREEDADAERDSVSNKQREIDMDKSKATIKIIGNPILQTKDTLTIGGTATEDLGNYYIKEIEHSIGPNSNYTCTGSLIKSIPFSGITSVIEPKKVDKDGNILEEDYKKRYDRERMLFKPGVSLELPTGKLDPDQGRVQGGVATNVTYLEEYETIKAVDILGSDKGTLDNNVGVLLNKYKNNRVYKSNTDNF